MIASELFAARLAQDATGPLITYYDDASGERTEVSASTLDNWVAKTANLLTDGLGLDMGSRIAVIAPPHWQTAGILLGAWAAGHHVVDFPDVDSPAQPEAVFCTEADLASYSDIGCDVVGLTLRPFGTGLTRQWPGVVDYAQEIGGYGDQFRPVTRTPSAAPALTAGTLELSHEGLAESAVALAERLGLSAGGRIMVTRELAVSAGPVAWLLAPLAAENSIVLISTATDTDPTRLAARAASEKVTATLGIELAGISALGG